MKIIIDRFEGDLAVIELPDKTMLKLPSVLFPDAKEGDVISIIIDMEATKERKASISRLASKLWAD